ncbi:MAG: hypothetical protein ABSE64_12255 [Vulcanimicrobiaceae bacterium]|jgi:hypothetical protein
MMVIAALLAGALAQASLQPYQPLVSGARYVYSCSGGMSAVRTIAGGSINGVSGFANMLSLTIPGQPSVQFGELQTNDSQGTKTGGWLFAPTYPSVQINPPQLELPINPVLGQNLSLPDGYGGTITVTYAGLATVTGYARVYTGVAVFKETDSGHPPVPFPRTVYMVKGIGEVQTDLAASQALNLPATTCTLASYSIP